MSIEELINDDGVILDKKTAKVKEILNHPAVITACNAIDGYLAGYLLAIVENVAYNTNWNPHVAGMAGALGFVVGGGIGYWLKKRLEKKNKY